MRQQVRAMPTKRRTKPKGAPKKAATKKAAAKKAATKKSAPKKAATKKAAPKKAAPKKPASGSAIAGEPASERPILETYDTNEEPHGRSQLSEPRTHDDVDDLKESVTDTTDIQTGLYVRRNDGPGT